VEASLRLSGWSQARRIVVLRRRVTGRLLAEGQADESQAHLLLADTPEYLPAWEYPVRITNTSHALEDVGRLYRDRADCENGFDGMSARHTRRQGPKRSPAAPCSSLASHV
jgi:hypothetical protein